MSPVSRRTPAPAIGDTLDFNPDDRPRHPLTGRHRGSQVSRFAPYVRLRRRHISLYNRAKMGWI